MSDLLVRFLGWHATVFHGDTMVLDRWRWLCERLPLTAPDTMTFLDVGCGSGAFTMGAARRGYRALGLSWDERNQEVATRRANLLQLSEISFPICDVRQLDQRKDLRASFDVAICFENIEHIVDDRKLVIDIFNCLKPGGRLLLTAPNFLYYPMAPGERGPFREIEDGAHVRRGYTPAMLNELCEQAGFRVEEIGYISHLFSQFATKLHRALEAVAGVKIGWLLFAPFRIVPPLFDSWFGRWLGSMFGRPGYSITLVAYKSRFVPDRG